MLFSFLGELLSHFFFLFGYIKADNLYPKPLSKTEEEHYVKKYLEENDKEAKDKLISHNLRLVAHIAKKYTSDEYELEEYTSIGTIGLIKAINSFNSTKGYKISTYASRCIENEILMYLRSNKKTKAEVSMNTVIGTDKDGNDMELMDTLEAEEKDIVDTIYNLAITEEMKKYIFSKLSEREKKIMVMRYGLDGKAPKTQQEVANILKISRSYVSRIETKVQSDLKEFMKSQ